MQYPLPEKIDIPELLVGRGKEFANFGQWPTAEQINYVWDRPL